MHAPNNWCGTLELLCASLALICSLQERISFSVTPHQGTSGLTSQMIRFLASSCFIKSNLPLPRSSPTQAKNMRGQQSPSFSTAYGTCPALISCNPAFLFPALPPFKTHPGVPGTYCPDRVHTGFSVVHTAFSSGLAISSAMPWTRFRTQGRGLQHPLLGLPTSSEEPSLICCDLCLGHTHYLWLRACPSPNILELNLGKTSQSLVSA